jgi:pimeloyl-ACP methyl ester carboxylesterase
MYGWDWVRDQLGWNIVVFDFREHGQSSHSPMICTLGFNEIWDVKAVIDHAQQQGLAEPYAICGYSLGGSVGLRWAAHDPRVKGVLAVSPYRNGLAATEQFLRGWLPLQYASGQVYVELRKMIGTVDLPTDVKKRNDLRLWIMVGENDIFPVSDQRAILSASPSPAKLKRLFVIPRAHHNNVWMWRGDEQVPSHDQIIRDFLDECR